MQQGSNEIPHAHHRIMSLSCSRLRRFHRRLLFLKTSAAPHSHLDPRSGRQFDFQGFELNGGGDAQGRSSLGFWIRKGSGAPGSSRSDAGELRGGEGEGRREHQRRLELKKERIGITSDDRERVGYEVKKLSV